MTDEIPSYLYNPKEQPEEEEEKELREKGIYEENPLDTDPSLLQLKPQLDAVPKVYPFKLGQVGPDFTLAFIGKRREGKSFCARWILSAVHHHFPRVWCFTNTKINGYWQDMIPDKFVFDQYEPAVMEQIIVRQKALIKWMKKHPDEAERQKVNPNIIIILDDCINQDLHHSLAEHLKYVFFNGRHLKILFIITLQYARGIPPGFRENIDMCFLYRMHSIAQKEAICENFLGNYPKKTALKILSECVWQDHETGVRQFLCVDTSGNSDLGHELYVGQATEPPKFKIGCEEWWKTDDPASVV